MAEIVELLASPVHRFEGRPGDGPAPAPPGELVDHVAIRVGLGIVGDRYCGHPAHRDSTVTVIAARSSASTRFRRASDRCVPVVSAISLKQWREPRVVSFAELRTASCASATVAAATMRAER